MPDGRIEERQIERLKEMGEWLARYGDGVYGTRGGPFKPGKWGASTCKENRVYLYVMNWPEEGPLELPAVEMKISGSKLLSGGTLDLRQTGDAVTVDVSADDRDEVATVIELTMDGTAFDIPPVDVPHRSNSLAYGKKATASNVYRGMNAQYGPQMAMDDDAETRWATDAGVNEAWLEVDLGEPQQVVRVSIDEPAEYSRIQEFQLQYRDGEDWKTFYEGKTVGPDWSKEIAPLTAQRFRLNILKATDGPTIWEFQLGGRPSRAPVE
jgi:alpha-L-fucosidase